MALLARTFRAAAVAPLLLAAACTSDTLRPADDKRPGSDTVATVAHDAIYVVNGGDASISVIDPASDVVVGTIRLRNVQFPHHLALSPDRSLLALAIPGSDFSGGHGHGGHSHGGETPRGTIMLLGATTGKTLDHLVLAEQNHNVVFSPDGAELWTSAIATPGRVTVLRHVGGLAPLDSIAVGGDPLEVTFSPDGAHLFVANNGSDNVTVIDRATRTVVKTIPVGDGPVGAWPGANGRMYVDNETGKSITVIDVATLEAGPTWPLGFRPAMAAVAPNGELWVSDPAGRIMRCNVADGQPIDSIPTAAGAHAILFTADGTKAYVTNQQANTVSVIDMATLTVVKTIPVGAKPNGMAWRSK